MAVEELAAVKSSTPVKTVVSEEQPVLQGEQEGADGERAPSLNTHPVNRIQRLKLHGLTNKEVHFLEYYLTVGSPSFSNGTKSAKRAGYSERSAYQIAHAILQKPKVKRIVNIIERQIEREWQERLTKSYRL